MEKIKMMFIKKSEVSTMARGYTGFTLAEVLITLGIIGTVAVMTIPTLVGRTNEAEHKAAYKRAYTAASQAWSRGWLEGNMLSVANSAIVSNNNFNVFKSYFKVSVDCSSSNNSTCWPLGDGGYWGSPDSTALAFIDVSGMSWSQFHETADGYYGYIHVDTNGLKSPNKYGIDRFVFRLYDVPGSLSLQDDFTAYHANYCPSGASHYCYYKSWILGN